MAKPTKDNHTVSVEFTSLDMILAVGTSHTSDTAMKSPKDDILSEPKCGVGRRNQLNVHKTKKSHPDSSLLTSCPGIGSRQWAEILHHVVHHAHSGFILCQRNSNCSSCKIEEKMQHFLSTYCEAFNLKIAAPSSCFTSSDNVRPVRVSPAGLTCLKEVAAGMSRALFSSRTSCQAFRASHRLINPGEPFTTWGMERSVGTKMESRNKQLTKMKIIKLFLV